MSTDNIVDELKKHNYTNFKSIIRELLQTACSDCSQEVMQIIDDYDKKNLNILNTECPDADVCIALGTHNDLIEKHFDNFQNFDHAIKFEKIGSDSANGFVILIGYEKDGYKANTILKSSQKKIFDNLYYEYLVGEFLNKQSKYFSCFVKTYGVFKYENESTYTSIKNCNNASNCNIQVLKSGLSIISDAYTDIDKNLKESCKSPTDMAILIQSLKGAKSMEEKLQEDDFVKNDLILTLFQIYMPLSCLADKFTHYDLHLNNVLLYEPKENSFIEYHYHMGPNDKNQDEIVTFKSSYISKIIDYGTSYFNNIEKNLHSDLIHDKVCEFNECTYNGDNCGKSQGYISLDKLYDSVANKISSQKNKSYDLLLLNNIYIILEEKFKIINNKQTSNLNVNERKIFNESKSKFSIVELLLVRVYESDPFGEIGKEQESKDDNKIRNVIDACEKLKFFINSYYKKYNDENYQTKIKIGDLHIYSDCKTQIKFIPVGK